MNEEITRPHTAVLNVQLEVHSLLDSGECSGHIIKSEILDEYGIKPAFLTSISGKTMDDCLKKLKQKIEKLNEKD